MVEKPFFNKTFPISILNNLLRTLSCKEKQNIIHFVPKTIFFNFNYFTLTQYILI